MLEVLHLDRNTALTSESGERLSHCRVLKELSIQSVGQTGAFIKAFLKNGNKDALQRLDCARSDLKDDDAIHISCFSNLESLSVEDCEFISDRFLQVLWNEEHGHIGKTSPKWEILNIAGTNITNSGGRDIGRFISLKELNAINILALGDDFFKNMFPDPDTDNYVLKKVEVSRCRISDDAAQYVSRFRQLEYFGANMTKIGDGFLKNILLHGDGVNTHIKQLSFDTCVNFTNECGTSLSRFIALKELSLSGGIRPGSNRLGDAAVTSLPPSMRMLRLGAFDGITDETRRQLAERMVVRG